MILSKFCNVASLKRNAISTIFSQQILGSGLLLVGNKAISIVDVILKLVTTYHLRYVVNVALLQTLIILIDLLVILLE